MRSPSLAALVITPLLAVAVTGPLHAAVVTLPFAGTLAVAQNNVYSDPSIPQGDFFFVGQAFSGSVRYDTDATGSSPDQAALLPLAGFDIVIGGVDFSHRFFPRLIGRNPDGLVEFVAGGADQGGGAILSFDLGTFAPTAPALAELSGRTATFTYNDYYPRGGQLVGRAITGAVPEPATWAMLVGGFALVGGAMRRRGGAARVRVRFG